MYAHTIRRENSSGVGSDHTLVHSTSTESIEQMYDVKSDEFHAMVRTSKDLYHNKSGTILDQGQARYQKCYEI
jgi:hypothetical protein